VLTPKIRSALVILAASAGLAGCTNLGPYGGVGVGVSSSYGGYGNYGYGYDPYYAGYGYGSAYGYNPYGWYNGYYYPGSGYWVYDRKKNRRPLTAAERAYWNERIRERMRDRRGLNTTTTSTAAAKENWSGFDRPATTTATGTVDRNQARAAMRQRVLEQRAQRQQSVSESRQLRSERQEARQQAASERRETRRVRRSTDD
jgi:hypothetical protein